MSQQKPLVFQLFNSLAYFHLENVKWVKSFSHLLGGISAGIWTVSRKQSTPNIPKNEHFLPPDTHTFSWNTRFEVRPFGSLPTKYLLFWTFNIFSVQNHAICHSYSLTSGKLKTWNKSIKMHWQVPFLKILHHESVSKYHMKIKWI